MAREIIVSIVADSSKFTKATTDAVNSAGLGGKAIAAGVAVGTAAYNVMATAVGMAIGKLGEAHQAYLDDQAGQVMLAQALQNNVPNWDGSAVGAEKYAASLGRLGFTDNDVRASLAQLVGVTHDLTAAQELTTMAADLARAKDIDLATATDIVTKAHEGNGKALKALGVDVGGAKTGAEMLTAIMLNANGAAETWAASNKGKLAVSNVKVQESMEKVGAIIDRVSQVIIPILADAFSGIVDVLGKVWDAIQPVITTITDALQPVFVALGTVIGRVWDGIVAATKTAADIVNGILNGIRAAIKIVSDAIDAVTGKGGTPEQRAEYERLYDPNTGMRRETPLPVTVTPKHTGSIGGYAAGGTVPGTGPQLAIVHGGETIIPAGQGARNITINVNGATDVPGIMQAIKRELARTGMSFA